MTQMFPIAPADIRWVWLIAAIPVIVVLMVVGVMGVSIAGARGARFEVSPDGLSLQGDFYGRVIPAAHLRPRDARRVDFARQPELVPRRRTMGTGLRGYQAGWFRLANGESALLYLTDRSRVVYVPTTEGYAVMLSPSDPDAFLTALRAMGG